MKMLIAIAVAQRGHVYHPEMIGEGADQAGGLFETMFDLYSAAEKPFSEDLTRWLSYCLL